MAKKTGWFDWDSTGLTIDPPADNDDGACAIIKARGLVFDATAQDAREIAAELLRLADAADAKGGGDE